MENKIIVIWEQFYDVINIISLVTPDKFEEAKAKYIQSMIDERKKQSQSSQGRDGEYSVSDFKSFDENESFGIRYNVIQRLGDIFHESVEVFDYSYRIININEF